jgi:glycosyltransferase involved in cell wall biosynthesis
LKLLVVIPTFNEAENIQHMLSALFLLPIKDLHVLVVDDNSPDGTGEIVEKLKQDNPGQINVIHRVGKLGLGTAYIKGFQFGLANGYDLIFRTRQKNWWNWSLQFRIALTWQLDQGTLRVEVSIKTGLFGANFFQGLEIFMPVPYSIYL